MQSLSGFERIFSDVLSYLFDNSDPAIVFERRTRGDRSESEHFAHKRTESPLVRDIPNALFSISFFCIKDHEKNQVSRPFTNFLSLCECQ